MIFDGIRRGVFAFSFAFLCIGVVLFLLAHYTSVSPAVRYFVGPKGIVLKHLFGSRAISYEEIENTITLTEKDAEAEILKREDKPQQILAGLRRKKGSAELSGDAGGMLSVAAQAFSEFFSSNARFYYFSAPRLFIDRPGIHG